MSLRKPLPWALHDAAFTAAAARAAGVPEHRLRAADLQRPFWGTRAHAAGSLSLADACRTLLQRMPPDAFISHGTAALLHDIPVPSRIEREGVIHVSVAAPARAQHATHVHGHSIEVHPDDVVRVDGLRVTSPARTWCDLAGEGVDLAALVAAGDRLLRWTGPLTTTAEIELTLRRHGRRRGNRMLAAAFPELVDRSESPRETRVRLAIVAAGLPRPTLNYELRDATGRLVARGDLAYPEYRMLLDYEGEHHRLDRHQWNRDLTRFNDIQDEEWYGMRIGADHDTADVVARIRRVLLRRGWRP